MKATFPTMTACLIAFGLCFAGCASRPQDSTRAALLSLPWQQFDQTQNSGWRVYAARGEHQEAAQLIEIYLKQHPDLTVRQRAVSHFHAGIEHVLDGHTKAGLVHLNQAVVPENTPGLSDDWNDMVIATRAFLKGDRPTLLAARARVAGLPRSSVQWPDYPDFLLDHFGRPYGSWIKEKQ